MSSRAEMGTMGFKILELELPRCLTLNFQYRKWINEMKIFDAGVESSIINESVVRVNKFPHA